MTAQTYLQTAIAAAQKAGTIITDAAQQLDSIQIESKAIADYVTVVDRTSEASIQQSIQDAHPRHAFLGEESGLSLGTEGSDEYVWIVDPLDGTTNFVHGIPHYAVSIALVHNGTPLIGVVHDPNRQETFSAMRGHGAQLNGTAISVTQKPSLKSALLGTGIPFRDQHMPMMETYLAMLHALVDTSDGIRRAGAAALDLAYVASGRLDGFWEFGLSQWDIAAGALLVAEAGGHITDFAGENGYLQNGNVVCANPLLCQRMIDIIKPLADRDINRK